MGNGDGTGVRSNVRNARRDIEVMNGLGSRSNVSRRHRNVLFI